MTFLSTRAHLDTDVLMAAIGFEDSTEVREIARRHVTGNNAIQAAVALPTLGELITKMTEKEDQGLGYERATQRLRTLIQDGRLEISWVGDYAGGIEDPYRNATKAQAVDTHLDPTDSLIIGCAISDPQAALLYTTDSYIESIPLLRLCNVHETKLKGP